MERVVDRDVGDLIRMAESAGLSLSVRDGKLRIDGPATAEPEAKALLSRAAEVKRAIAERDAGRINASDASMLIGCPFTRPLVRGPGIAQGFVSCTAIPGEATEYHAHGNTWLTIPEHWKAVTRGALATGDDHA